MSEESALLTAATNPFQASAIEATLRSAGIAFWTKEAPSSAVVFLGPLYGGAGYLEFHVASDQLKEAKDALCAGGIVCEVSERLFRRSLEDIVKPLLSDAEPDYGRLVRFLELNNKETVKAIFEATLELGGGRELLEDLFFHLARSRHPGLRSLARVLGRRTTASFAERYSSDASVGEKETRIALLDVLAEFKSAPWHLEVLATALLDRDSEIREAASEALFELRGRDCGYDPEDPPAEREAAIEEILGRS
jgi:hypothetical protein